MDVRAQEYATWKIEYDAREASIFAQLLQQIDALARRPKILIACIEAGPVQGQPRAETQAYPATHISIAKNAPPTEIVSAARAANADLILLIDDASVLAPSALLDFVLAAEAHPAQQIFFADEERRSQAGTAFLAMRAEFDPIAALAVNGLGPPTLCRTAYLDHVLARRRPGPIGSLDLFLYQLGLLIAATGEGHGVHHLPLVLSSRPVPQPWATADAVQSFRDYATAPDWTAAPSEDGAWLDLMPNVGGDTPSVSIIMLTRDQPAYLRCVLQGLLEGTAYDSFELLIVDNGTIDDEALALLDAARSDPRVRVFRNGSPFNFARLNNEAARDARGEYLVLLNSDIEIIDARWLARLMIHAQRRTIGAVGARLLYPDGRIQHAGIVFGPDDRVEHKFRFCEGRGPAIVPDLQITHCVSAVTAACVALSARTFNAIGGFDENLAVGFNDIDLCRSIANLGQKILYAADVSLVHHESVTRGKTFTLRSEAIANRERYLFWSKHRDLYLKGDPFRSPFLLQSFDTTSLVPTAAIARPHIGWSSQERRVRLI